jgi:hypothetical protein
MEAVHILSVIGNKMSPGVGGGVGGGDGGGDGGGVGLGGSSYTGKVSIGGREERADGGRVNRARGMGYKIGSGIVEPNPGKVAINMSTILVGGSGGSAMAVADVIHPSRPSDTDPSGHPNT